MKKRKTFLLELLFGIFKNKDVAVDDKRIYKHEKTDKALFGRCTFEKKVNNNRDDFIKLIRMALLEKDTEYDFNIEGNILKSDHKIPCFSQKEALSNSFDFIINQGVRFTSMRKEIYLKTEEANEQIYGIMLVFLLCIFPLYYHDKLSKDDDISAEIHNTVMNINREFSIAFWSSTGYEEAIEDNTVVEDGNSKSECNFFVPVSMNDIGISTICPIHTAFAIRRIENEEEKEDIFDIEYKYNALIIGLMPYDYNINSVSNYKRIGNIYNNGYKNDPSVSDLYFYISDKDFDAIDPNKKNIYFLFKLNIDKFKVFYNNTETSDDLRKAIINSGKVKITEMFKKHIINYCIAIVDYIDDVLHRLSAIDTNKLNEGIVDEKTAVAFNPEFKKPISILKKCKNIDVESYLCLIFKELIANFERFTFFPLTKDLAQQIVCYVDNNRIGEHRKIILDFIHSEMESNVMEINNLNIILLDYLYYIGGINDNEYNDLKIQCNYPTK